MTASGPKDAPHSAASTGSGSSSERPSPMARRIMPGCSPSSSRAAALLSQASASAWSAFCTSSRPAARSVGVRVRGRVRVMVGIKRRVTGWQASL